MHTVKQSFEYTVFSGRDELSASDGRLMDAAIAARERAYAPYSGFRVGAAVLLANGQVVTGNNQENASFPSGLCAERVAVYQAGALYPEVALEAIAISAASQKIRVSSPVAPCGNCRQAIAEYEQRQAQGIRILFGGSEGPVYSCNSLADLLPLGFSRSDMEGAKVG